MNTELRRVLVVTLKFSLEPCLWQPRETLFGEFIDCSNFYCWVTFIIWKPVCFKATKHFLFFASWKWVSSAKLSHFFSLCLRRVFSLWVTSLWIREDKLVCLVSLLGGLLAEFFKCMLKCDTFKRYDPGMFAFKQTCQILKWTLVLIKHGAEVTVA